MSVKQIKQSNLDCESKTGVTSNQDCKHETKWSNWDCECETGLMSNVDYGVRVGVTV